MAEAERASRPCRIAIERGESLRWTYDTLLLPDEEQYRGLNTRCMDRLLKFLLWARGGERIRIAGAPEIVAELTSTYRQGGDRAFDDHFLGVRCFSQPLQIENARADELEPRCRAETSNSIDLRGHRIGFDLGGSDRKCAALIDGEVVFSEEVKWDPYFQDDPQYHLDGVQDSLKRAARHLPSVDAIGGSAAGIYVDNEPRVGSLFRGVGEVDFDRHVRGIFHELRQRWGNIPFEVANDGDVTALAGAIHLRDNAVLGISMGTSEAAGYIDANGTITGWLNELAFAPVDYHPQAPEDEWSGDRGCGVQYFSQQALGRLLPRCGIHVDPSATLPERLELLQHKMADGDERAELVYQTVGRCFGYAVAHYADFYDFHNLLVLGRVTSGSGGDLLIGQAREVLAAEFPECSEKIRFQEADESMKRHGQAVAAAALPRLPSNPQNV